MSRAAALRAAGYAATAVPFAFGVARYVSTGNDFRYVWPAVAAFGGAMVATRLGRRSALLKGPTQLAIVVLIASTALAYGAGYLVGARNVVSMLIVSLSFGACFAVGALLRRLAVARV